MRYPAIVEALAALPDETIIDGEVVALDESGRPSFNTLQNYCSSKAPILYYVFDVLIVGGRDAMGMPLSARRDILERIILPKLGDPIRCVLAFRNSLLAFPDKLIPASGLREADAAVSTTTGRDGSFACRCLKASS